MATSIDNERHRNREWDVRLDREKHAAQPRHWSLSRSAFTGFRFPPEVIVVAVRWYLRYGLSYHDVEKLLAERGIKIDHVTVYRWCSV